MQLADVGEATPHSLTLEERAALEVQMRLRRSEGKLASVRFWGRITGSTHDYLIVCGLPEDAQSPTRRFFYAATNELTLHPLPELSQEFEVMASAADGQGAKSSVKVPSRFSGVPSTVLQTDADGEEQEEEQLDENGNPLPGKEKFSEVHWLAYTVRNIERDTAVVPKGAIAVTPTHTVQENRLFSGLSASEAANGLSALLHLRTPTGAARSSALGKAAALSTADFLDPISEDSPAGQVWAVRVDENEGRLIARSLKWPGYEFYHDVQTSNYGGVYVGEGRPSTDLSFML